MPSSTTLRDKIESETISPTDANYNIILANNKKILTIGESDIDESTSLELFGKKSTSYGRGFWGNLIHILENFNNTKEPRNPLAGQLWFNGTNLKLCTNTPDVLQKEEEYVSNGTDLRGQWLTIPSTSISNTTPDSASLSSFHINTSSKVISYKSGDSWIDITTAYGTKPTNPYKGQLYYDTTIKALEIYKDTAWETITGGNGNDVIIPESSTATSGAISYKDKTLTIHNSNVSTDITELKPFSLGTITSISAGAGNDSIVGGMILTAESNITASWKPLKIPETKKSSTVPTKNEPSKELGEISYDPTSHILSIGNGTTADTFYSKDANVLHIPKSSTAPTIDTTDTNGQLQFNTALKTLNLYYKDDDAVKTLTFNDTSLAGPSLTLPTNPTSPKYLKSDTVGTLSWEDLIIPTTAPSSVLGAISYDNNTLTISNGGAKAVTKLEPFSLGGITTIASVGSGSETITDIGKSDTITGMILTADNSKFASWKSLKIPTSIPSSPESGNVYFNTSDDKLKFYKNDTATWIDLIKTDSTTGSTSTDIIFSSKVSTVEGSASYDSSKHTLSILEKYIVSPTAETPKYDTFYSKESNVLYIPDVEGTAKGQIWLDSSTNNVKIHNGTKPPIELKPFSLGGITTIDTITAGTGNDTITGMFLTANNSTTASWKPLTIPSAASTVSGAISYDSNVLKIGTGSTTYTELKPLPAFSTTTSPKYLKSDTVGTLSWDDLIIPASASTVDGGISYDKIKHTLTIKNGTSSDTFYSKESTVLNIPRFIDVASTPAPNVADLSDTIGQLQFKIDTKKIFLYYKNDDKVGVLTFRDDTIPFTEPSSPKIGQYWFDESDKSLNMFNTIDSPITFYSKESNALFIPKDSEAAMFLDTIAYNDGNHTLKISNGSSWNAVSVGYISWIVSKPFKQDSPTSITGEFIIEAHNISFSTVVVVGNILSVDNTTKYTITTTTIDDPLTPSEPSKKLKLSVTITVTGTIDNFITFTALNVPSNIVNKSFTTEISLLRFPTVSFGYHVEYPIGTPVIPNYTILYNDGTAYTDTIKIKWYKSDNSLLSTNDVYNNTVLALENQNIYYNVIYTVNGIEYPSSSPRDIKIVPFVDKIPIIGAGSTINGTLEYSESSKALVVNYTKGRSAISENIKSFALNNIKTIGTAIESVGMVLTVDDATTASWKSFNDISIINTLSRIPQIGSFFNGGYYYGTMKINDTDYYIIVDSFENKQLSMRDTAISFTSSGASGYDYTYEAPTTFQASNYVKYKYVGDVISESGWFIPSLAEWLKIYNNRTYDVYLPRNQRIFSNIPFGTNIDDTVIKFATSCNYSATNDTPYMEYSSRDDSFIEKKSTNLSDQFFVRAFRRVEIV